MSTESLLLDVADIGDDDSEYFRQVDNRTLNTLNSIYMLPTDEEEVKVATGIVFFLIEFYKTICLPS